MVHSPSTSLDKDDVGDEATSTALKHVFLDLATGTKPGDLVVVKASVVLQWKAATSRRRIEQAVFVMVARGSETEKWMCDGRKVGFNVCSHSARRHKTLQNTIKTWSRVRLFGCQLSTRDSLP